MRKHKFIAWDLIGKVMINGFAISSSGEIMFTKKRAPDGKYKYSEVEGYGNDRFIIREYTGLKDKNGKEIYEFDIIALEGSDTPKIMEYNRGSFLLDCIYTGAEVYRMEVIGNIYENPELLETKLAA